MDIWAHDPEGVEVLKDMLEQAGLTITNIQGPRITIVESPIDPGIVFPELPEEFVKLVGFQIEVFSGMVIDGLYYSGSATLVAKFEVIHLLNFRKPKYCQILSIGGNCIDAITEIHDLVRKGALLPSENWEDRSQNSLSEDVLRRAREYLYPPEHLDESIEE